MMLMTLLMVLMPIMVAAQTTKPAAPAQAAGQQWWQTLLVTVIEVALAIFIPVLGVLVYSLLNRWGISVEKEQVDKIATQAMQFADQKAKVLLKHEGKRTPGAEKAKIALDFAKKLADEYKLTEKARDALAYHIEAAVAKKKAEEGKTLPAPSDKPSDPPSDTAKA